MSEFSGICKTSTGSRMAADERRSQILQVAMQLFSQRGFRGTTTREIAQVAGVSEAMVFRHFATKQDLYKAILDHQICHSGKPDKLAALAEKFERKDDFAVFYQIAYGALISHAENEDFLRLLLYSALDRHELADMFFEGFVAEIYEVVGSYISRRQQDGDFRRDIEPRVVVRALLGMLIHHSLNNLLWDKGRKLLDISKEEAARQFTEILLNGVKVGNEG